MNGEYAWAKLNLTLDILGKRPDGYHDLKMVMASVSLRDDVAAEEVSQPGVSLRTNAAFLPTDGGNLAVKAALRFFEALGTPPPGLALSLEKRIPVCAGMGGGSSDAAAVLRLLRRRYAPSMTWEALEETGAGIGSDVPYCVRGGVALAEGRGERLTRLPSLPPCWFVVCKPSFSLSTPALFAQVQVGRLKCRPDTAGILSALEAGDLEGIAHRLYNVFEDVVPRRCGQIFEIKGQMLELGAMASAMTGTGPTVFGLYRDRDAARAAAEVLAKRYPATFFCEPVPECK